MSPLEYERRLLLVHAHPDDESIETGGTMARYAAEGAYVCLVTCTLGEEGEVIPDEFRHLAADRDDRLGPHRMGELAAACDALGVVDRRFLGGPGRWRDSGMMGVGTNDDPRCFWRADVERAAADLVPVIREVRPQVVVTYDARGYYGHPDHIQAHRVTRAAAELAADPSWTYPSPESAATAGGTGGRAGGAEPWRAAKFYATAMPLSALESGLARLRAADSRFGAVGSIADLPFGVPDEQVTTGIDVAGQIEAKVAALRAHHTQILVDPPFLALSNDLGQEIGDVEYYTLLAGDLGLANGPDGRESDLFAGV